jgi:hypothetical protein
VGRAAQSTVVRVVRRDLERWANAIEGRDDIGLDTDAADALKEAIFELANPR